MYDHKTSSVSFIRHTTAQTGTWSARCVFGLTKWNRLFRFHDCYIIMVRHQSWTARKTSYSAPRLQCYNINMCQKIKYAQLCFQFFQTKLMTDCVSFICHSSSQARRTLSCIHTHLCISKRIYKYAQSDFWQPFASWFTSNISTYNTGKVWGQLVQMISHTVCTTIYIVYRNTQKTC